MPGPFYFAWTGGAIQPQVTIITNGTTHGGIIQSVTLVGDIGGYLGDQQIRNIADTSGLQDGTLYRVEDTSYGIAANTYFLYDPMSGLAPPDTVNLNTVTGTANSVTFQCTQAIPVGDTVATFTRGSNVVLLGNVDLPSAVYSMSAGGPIGQTATPFRYADPSATPTLVSSVGFVYDGYSQTANMIALAANGSPTLLGALIGPEHVAIQEVTALFSGQEGVEIMGMPDGDWYSVTSIPTGALADLIPGLRYNISGNGIQVGTTFIAPPRGSTAITLDLPASASNINAILTITGPRTPGAPFDPTVDNRFDEQVLGFEIAQQEGNFATLNVSLLNPDVGLLAIGRNLWCWLSYDQAWTPDGTGTPDIVPLFTGRLVGVPKLQADEIVTLEFLARPDDFNVQKVGITEALSVLPYYDPVWLASNVSPDTVLETYSSLFHIDRVSLAVTTSDILQGEDGTLTIGEDAAFYDNFSLTYGEPPLTAVTLSGTVNWQQEADGFVDVTQAIKSAFDAGNSQHYELIGGVSAGAYNSGLGGFNSNYIPGISGGFSPYITPSAALTGGYLNQYIGTSGFNFASLPGQLISLLNGDGLYSDWPKPGANLGAGWSLSTYTDQNGYPQCFIESADQPQGWLSNQVLPVNVAANDPYGASTNDFVLTATSNILVYQYQFKLTTYKMRMVLRYEASRKRTETVNAVLVADVQRELSDNSGQDQDSITLTSDYVGQPVDPGGLIPIGYLARNSYFQCDRGTDSFAYLMLLARAKMRARARNVEITFGVAFQTALGMTLRNSVTYFDRRLPGGSATGKVKSYKLTMGEAGWFGEFTIGCSIGNGNPVVPVVGVNSYVDDGYVDPGYQVVAGSQTALIASELAYQSLDQFVVKDDGINFYNLTADNAIDACIVNNNLTQQMEGLLPGALPFTWENDIYQMMGISNIKMKDTLHTTVMLAMKPLAGGEFHTDFFPAISQLALPKTIDLSLATGPSGWDKPIGGAAWDSGTSSWDTPA